MSSSTGSQLSRRSVLRASAVFAGSGALLGLAQGCSSGSSGAGGKVTLNVQGWVYDPTFDRDVAAAYNKAHPNVLPQTTFTEASEYIAKVTGLFTANAAPDIIFAHDNDIAGFVESGYIQPINGLPGMQQALNGMITFDRESLDYKGKTWGTPYYGDVMAFVYNTEMSKKAGIGATDIPQTWDDVAAHAMQVKKAGILDHPFVFPMDNTSGRHWFAALHGSGGSMFDEKNNPVFPDQDPTAVKFLTFLVSAAKSGILDPASLGMGTTTGKQAFQAGKAAFMTDAHYDMKAINDPTQSKVAGQCGQYLMPTLTSDGPHGTLGFSAAYCISAKTQYTNEAWNFAKYLGGLSANRQLFLRDGQAPAFTSLQKDPQVLADLKKWCDPDLANQQTRLATRQEALDAPWFAEWQVFNQQQIQEAVLGKATPEAAMKASADKARSLNNS
jgi:multiple sugar transport system substrate-binding protein